MQEGAILFSDTGMSPSGAQRLCVAQVIDNSFQILAASLHCIV